MRNLDSIFDVSQVAVLGRSFIAIVPKVWGPEMSFPRSVVHKGLFLGEVVEYYTNPTEDPTGEVIYIIRPSRTN
jgi:hypothetical protein